MSLPIKAEKSTLPTESSFLCALFDFNTFVLKSEVLTLEQFQDKKRYLPLNYHVTNHAVEEYTNSTNHTTITLITLSPQVLKRLKYVKIPCLAKKTSIYIRKFKDKPSNSYFIQLSTTTNIDHKTQIIPYTCSGMVFAIIYSTFTSKFIVNGIYYHGHNTNIYKPDFNREKDTRISKPFDIFIPTENNTIHSLRELKKKMKKKSQTISDANAANVANDDGTNTHLRKRRRKKVKRKKLNKIIREEGSREEINIGLHCRSVSLSSVSSLHVNASLTPLTES
jgi:hypothetical protein